MKKLGIIAGSGRLPTIAAQNIYQRKIELRIYSLSSSRQIKEEYMPELRGMIAQASASRLHSLMKQLKKDGISDVLLLGKFEKKNIFKNFFFDKATLRLLMSIKDRSDSTIFSALLEEFKKNGLTIISQKKFLEELLLPEGVYSKKKPSKKEWEEIEYGMFHAKEISGLDIGQTVVVRNKSVVAVEAVESTDQCIERAGSLIQKKGGVVCKVERKKQDDRFDIPTVGIQTLQTMKKSGCFILAIEANKTFVVTPEEVRRKANQLGITFVSVKNRLSNRGSYLK